MSEYLAHPAIGSSHLKQILYSPRDFVMYKSRNRKDTPQTILGEATHCILTELDQFAERFAVQPEDWGPKNAGSGYKRWKEFKEENAGKHCLGWENKQFLDDLLVAREEHTGIRHIFDKVGGYQEVTAYTKEEDGFQLKARTDWLGNNGILWDIKTSSKGVSEFEMNRTIKDMGYHFQAAHHMHVLSEHAEIRDFGWIFIDTDSPSVNIVTRLISQSLLVWGQKDFNSAINQLKECVDTDIWPRRYDDEITTLKD